MVGCRRIVRSGGATVEEASQPSPVLGWRDGHRSGRQFCPPRCRSTPDLPVHCGVAGTTKSSTPCVFCGTTGSLSTEHVLPKWVRKALQISEPVREFSGTTHVGGAETLAIVFHEVCVSCNTGWMETLETITRPVLGPLLLGAAPDTSRMLDPDQQAILATWAVKTSLLLTLSKFRGQEHGWIPVSSLQWLRQHHGSRMPPPGTRVWMAGLSTSDIPASVQAACLYDADGEATAQCVTFPRLRTVPGVCHRAGGRGSLAGHRSLARAQGAVSGRVAADRPVQRTAPVATQGRVLRRGPGSSGRTAPPGPPARP